MPQRPRATTIDVLAADIENLTRSVDEMRNDTRKSIADMKSDTRDRFDALSKGLTDTYVSQKEFYALQTEVAQLRAKIGPIFWVFMTVSGAGIIGTLSVLGKMILNTGATGP